MQVVSPGQDALRAQESGGELEVVAGRTHRDSDSAGRDSGPREADLEGLLGGKPVLP